jgi:hypothetical protein
MHCSAILEVIGIEGKEGRKERKGRVIKWDFWGQVMRFGSVLSGGKV